MPYIEQDDEQRRKQKEREYEELSAKIAHRHQDYFKARQKSFSSQTGSRNSRDKSGDVDIKLDSLPVIFGIIGAVSTTYLGSIALYAVKLRRINLYGDGGRAAYNQQLRLDRALTTAESTQWRLYMCGFVMVLALIVLLISQLTNLANEEVGEWLKVGSLLTLAISGGMVIVLLIFKFALQRFDQLSEVSNAGLYNSWQMAFVLAFIPVVAIAVALADDLEIAVPMLGLWLIIGFGAYWYWSSQFAS